MVGHSFQKLDGAFPMLLAIVPALQKMECARGQIAKKCNALVDRYYRRRIVASEIDKEIDLE
jgi:hypothetical protein